MDAAGHPAMLFVDGVSSIGSMDFRMDDWGVDVAVTGSQQTDSLQLHYDNLVITRPGPP